MPVQTDLPDELQARLNGATGIAVFGVGYELGSDDGAGLLAAKGILRRRPDLPVYLTGSAPENYTGPVVKAHPSHVIFIDAAEMRMEPGTVACIDQSEIKGTHFSTHTLPLSTIMEYLALSIGAKSFAVGIQPAREGFGEEVSPGVQAAAERVAEDIVKALAEVGL